MSLWLRTEKPAINAWAIKFHLLLHNEEEAIFDREKERNIQTHQASLSKLAHSEPAAASASSLYKEEEERQQGDDDLPT